jgi:DNA polymerase-3 subunit gamma/tau
MGQVLYRKYRSKSLDEIVGQEHITTTLKNALKTDAISHAYLFTGPRGVGKTSIARILAHEVNRLEYTGEDAHLDIIEIDAASNRGIDEIRDLREKVNVAPTLGKYKVYIIDEVHMLTTPAFNALLKTLEEPPAHVIFILATTESHKLPATIISRTQRYNFRPVEKAKVISHLQHIAKQEKLKIDATALEMIADHGEGSFRDSISLLNQAAGHDTSITAATIQSILGLPPETVLTQLFESLADSKQAVVAFLNQLYDQGYQAGTIAKHLGRVGREAILGVRTAPIDEPVLLRLLSALLDVPVSPAPERLLEIILLQASPAAAQMASQPVATTKPAARSTTSVKATAISKPEATTQPIPEQTQPTKAEQATAGIPGIPAEPLAFTIDTVWPELLKTIKTKHNTVYGILRMANPELSGDELVLTFKYAFHQKRMAEAKHRQIISDCILHLTGHSVTINCQYDKAMSERTPLGVEETETMTTLIAEPTLTNSPVSTISNIFGGAELLES